MPEVPLGSFVVCLIVILGDGDASSGTEQQFVAVPHHEL